MKSESVLALADMKLHEEAVVSHVHTQDRQALQRIIAMGVLSGMRVKLLQKFPSYVFQIGESRFAVDRELAASVFVHLP